MPTLVDGDGDEVPPLDAGTIRVTDRPGLGVTVDVDALKRFRVHAPTG